MKVVIRNLTNQMFYVSPGLWADRLELAREFTTSCDAFRHAREERLRGVEVYHSSVVPGMEFAVPVDTCWPVPTAPYGPARAWPSHTPG